MIDCKEHHAVCGASCCRSVVFWAQGEEAGNLIGYWNLHGFKVVEYAPHRYKIIIPAKCDALREDLLCDLMNEDGTPKPERPAVCNELDFGNTKSYHITEGCPLT